MDSRQKFYKATGRSTNKLQDRVISNRENRKNSRVDKFNSTRNINSNFDNDSPMGPIPSTSSRMPPPRRAVERVKKLQDYRLQKNIVKLKSIQEQKVPFHTVVPSGVWLNREDSFKRRALSAVNLNETPVKQILMKPRSIRRSTVNKVLQHSSNKAVKSKKIISKKPSRETKMFTFSVSKTPSPRPQSSPEDVELPETPMSPAVDMRNRSNRSNLMIIEERASEVSDALATSPKDDMTEQINFVPAPTVFVFGSNTEAVDGTSQSETEEEHQKDSPVTIIANNIDEVDAEKPELNSSSSTFVIGTNSVENSFTFPHAPSTSTEGRVERESAPPEMFADYKHRLAMRIQSLMTMMETIEFGEGSERLTEHQKLKLEQTKFLVLEAEKKFDSFLRQYETPQNSRDSTSILTEDDMDNYWYLVSEEMETLKKAITDIQTDAVAAEEEPKRERAKRRKKKQETNSERKRQSMRLINTGTPKRHNPACFGCESASKLGTPKSASRKSAKKSIFFADANVATPTKTSRRSSRKLF